MSDSSKTEATQVQPSREDPWMLTLAGVLDICAGATSLIGGSVLAFLAAGAWTIPHHINEPMAEWPLELGFGLFFGLSAMLILLGVFAVVGGIHALRRTSWFWAVVGSIAATLSCFPLGIAAIVLTVMSDNALWQKGRP